LKLGIFKASFHSAYDKDPEFSLENLVNNLKAYKEPPKPLKSIFSRFKVKTDIT
jgi:hypothetical protein